jgi:alkylhydroperoxidase/carboxymuconolactone decarboxylase family protein YurZ
VRDAVHGSNAHDKTTSTIETEWVSRLDHTEQLRRLAINDADFAQVCLRGTDCASAGLDAKTLALARLAALVAVGGSVPSFGAHADAAVSAGASPAEIVEVVVGVVPTVGLPRAVAAAPKVGMALGYDIGGAFDDRSVDGSLG